jgi:hypothetical protein
MVNSLVIGLMSEDLDEIVEFSKVFLLSSRTQAARYLGTFLAFINLIEHALSPCFVVPNKIAVLISLPQYCLLS